MQKEIYLVSVLGAAQQELEHERYRVWGYYFDLETARQCVLENWTDISELGYYRYGVISQMGEGPLACPETQEWYEFEWEGDAMRRKYKGAKKVEQPEELGNTIYGF
jgi:hypothetical protein